MPFQIFLLISKKIEMAFLIFLFQRIFIIVILIEWKKILKKFINYNSIKINRIFTQYYYF